MGQEWEGRGKEKDIFETEAVLTQTLVQVLSTHSPDIVLDKYNFELGYDDDFDMGGYFNWDDSQRWLLWIFLGEFALDEDSDAAMPGLKLKLSLARIISQFLSQV